MSDIARKISDKEAVQVLTSTATRRAQPATKFVTRTVVYPVNIFYKPGIATPEIRTFVRQNEYCSRAQWEQALAYEKQYPELQQMYRADLKKKGIPVEVREPGNPLKATVIDIR